MGDIVDESRMRSQFEEAPHALISIEILIRIHFYMVLVSYHQSHAKTKWIPYKEETMNQDSLIKNQTRELVLTPLDHNISICHGSTKRIK